MLALCLALLLGSDDSITVNPNRPTFASPAATTQPYVLELEQGSQGTFNRDSSKVGTLPGLLKYGVSETFEFRAGYSGLLVTSQPGVPTTSQSFTSPSLGCEWRYDDGGAWGISKSIQITHTFSSGNTSGTATNFIFSSDLSRGFHVDVNAQVAWNETSVGSTDRQYAQAFSVSKLLSDHWSCGGEIYSISPTSSNARVYSNLWYVAYKVRNSLVVDFGTDIGLNQGAQRYSIFCGLTMGIHRFK